MRRYQPRQNLQRNSRSDRARIQGTCHDCGMKGRQSAAFAEEISIPGNVYLRSDLSTKRDQQGIRTVAYGASAVGAYSNDWVIDSPHPSI